MPRTIELKVYSIDELKGTAKERARDWARKHKFDYEWYDFVFDDFEEVCKIAGVEIDRDTPDASSNTGGQRRIFFRGFYSQGDGASFEGSYAAAEGAPRKIRAERPTETVLHEIVDRLEAVQEDNAREITAQIKQRSQGGSYVHEHTMEIEVERDNALGRELAQGADDVVIEEMRNLARWLYRALEQSYDEMTTDEAIDEDIRTNEWMFTAHGEFVADAR